MKIAILSKYQGCIQRGAETFVIELSRYLAKEHEVVVLSGKDADSLSKVLKGKFDVVIPINGRLQSLKASLGRVLGGYRLLITGQSGIGKDDYWNILIARPDVFVTLTEKAFNWASKFALGVKVVKIPNGVDLQKYTPLGQKFSIDLEKPIILCVGALVWYKYQKKAIEAVSRLTKGSLLLVGNGEMIKELAVLGREKLGERFEIIDVSFRDMPKVYRSADIFTLPSWDREAFGIVYLEAMASNLAVVAPDDSSRREIIDGAGVLVNVEDTQKYAQAIKKALDKNWGNKPRRQAKKFSWDKIAEQYKRIIDELLKK